MKIPFSGLTGAVLNFANAVQAAFDRLISVPLNVVDDAASLPNPDGWKNRQVIVRDIDGAGTMGVATALDGAWYDNSGGAL